MIHMRDNWRWFLAAVVVTAVSLLVLFAPEAQATGGLAGDPTQQIASPSKTGWPDILSDRQIFNEDLVVKSGEIIRENVAVFNGDVTIESGGKILGNLAVFRGDVKVSGEIDGDLAVMSGDAKLTSTARITGDVSVFGGDVEQEPGAVVGGNVVGGPHFQFDGAAFPFRGQIQPEQVSFADRLTRLFLRMLQALLWVLVIVGLGALLVWLTPSTVTDIAVTASADPPLSFAVGLIATATSLFLALLLTITICLAPAAFLLMALLFVVGIVGWTVVSYLFGKRLAEALEIEANLLLTTVAGAAILTGVSSFMWALSTCLGFILFLLIGSTGVGAVIIHFVRSRASDRGPAVGAPGPARPAGGPPPTGSSQEETPPNIVTGEELGISPETAETLQRGVEEAGEAEETPQRVDILPEEDDFTKIKGIGPTFDQRLKAANVRTFAALASMSPEQIAQILGWPPERVIRDQLVEQAKALAKRQD
jgi:predicted flap endonuclease-1-like 5' DNA nuclease